MIEADTLREWCQQLRDSRAALVTHIARLRARGTRPSPEVHEALKLTIILLGEIEEHLPEVQDVYVPAVCRDAGVAI